MFPILKYLFRKRLYAFALDYSKTAKEDLVDYIFGGEGDQSGHTDTLEAEFEVFNEELEPSEVEDETHELRYERGPGRSLGFHMDTN